MTLFNAASILVVDDRRAQRELYTLLAQTLNINAHVVSSAAEALEALVSMRFDAILMDLRMPDMDGLECTQKIREMEKMTGRHVPIIAVTACCFPNDEGNCLDAGMDDYLAKPFTLDALEKN